MISGLYVQIEGFAERAGLFGAVQHCDFFNRLGYGLEEIFSAERPVKMYAYEAVFASGAVQMIDGLLYGFGNGAHGDDYIFGLFVAVIYKRTIFAACKLAYFAHIACNYVRNFLIYFIAHLHSLEINVTVLGCSADNGGIRAEGSFTEVLEGFFAYHIFECGLVENLNLLYFVAGAETIEEMQERNAALDCAQMRYCGKVLRLLYRAGSKKGKACLAACHYVLMVSEDGEGVACKCAGRHVKYAGKKFAGHLIHIGNHEQETLRSGISAGKGACLKRAVHCSCGSGFTF